MTTATVIDQYAGLSHRVGLDERRPGALTAPTWVPPDHMRRITAYTLLAATLNNVARRFIDSVEAPDRREYGDPALLVDRICAALLGDTVTITVDGADTPTAPVLPPKPEPAPPDASPLEERVAAVALARWERDAGEAVDEWVTAVEAAPDAAARQRWLREWADENLFAASLRLAELDALGLGDGVLVVTAAEGEAPQVTRYDPGFYFPVTSEPDGGGDVTKVHLAWEYDADGTHVRRLTWELQPLVDGDGEPATRPTPWGTAASVACVFTDLSWPVNNLGSRDVDDFDLSRATVHTEPTDLGIDFLPVVHIEGVDVGAGFGQSVLTVVAQLLDELAAADTDLSAAGSLAAGPVIALSGGDAGTEPRVVKPGVVWSVPAGGRMDVLDVSVGLAALGDVVDALLDRLSVNRQVPGEVLGRVPKGDVSSGVKVALRHGPFRQFIESLRVTHVPQWGRVLDMVQRVAQVYGVLEAGPTPSARVTPGGYLPTDVAAVVEMVAEAVRGRVMSTETGIRVLVAAGVPIDDAAGELARIRAGDPEGARAAADATGSEQVGADWLGVVVDPTPPPDIEVGR